MQNVYIKLLRDGAICPFYASKEAAGADVCACITEPLLIKSGETKMVPTGFSMALNKGFAAFIYARSGMAAKRGLAPANKVGVVDSDYRGEVFVALHNHSEVDAVINSGERIAQMVIAAHETAVFSVVESLDATARGAGGFGSTGDTI